MKSSLLLSASLCAAVAVGQAQTSGSSSQTPPSTSPSASSQLQVRGPDAVAQKDPNRIVATINGKQITAKEADGFLKAIPPEQLKRYEANLPTVVQQIYMSKELAQEAAKMNLDQQSPWKEQLQLTRDQILAQAYLNKKASTSSGAAPDAQAYYNNHLPEFDKVKLSGIFIAFNPPGTPASGAASGRTEEQARAKADDLEKKLKAGGDFSTLARTDSDNQQAAAKGGDLGTYSVGDPQLPAPIKTAVEKLQTGQSTDPIRIPNALLIVKLDSRNKLTFDQAKPEITQKLLQEQNQAAVKQETDKYKIQVQDPAFFNGTGTTGARVPSLARPGSPSGSPAKP